MNELMEIFSLKKYQKMNQEQKNLVEEFRECASLLAHSPKRREMPNNLIYRANLLFGSFNAAKKTAKLEIFNTKNSKINKSLLKKDLQLVRIVAFINFDGHLAKDLKSFYYSSKSLKDVQYFERIVEMKFNVKCRLKQNSTGSRGQTHICWVFNKPLTQELEKLGVVKGDKVTSEYSIPRWITSNREYSREFLKIAFFCEGSNKEEKGRSSRIKFSMHKSLALSANGVEFTNQLKSMLNRLGIQTTPVYVYDERVRKDGVKTKAFVFRVSQKYNDKFIKEIGWFK
jgi:intein/homing endonuclease